MIGKTELVISNLYRYFYALTELEKAKLELEKLNATMGVHSPNLTGEHGYNGTKDEKLLNYSIKKEKLDNEIKGWQSESQMYYNILHLYELEEADIKFLTLMYQEKKSGEQIAKEMYFTNRMYVNRKKDALLERLSKFV